MYMQLALPALASLMLQTPAPAQCSVECAALEAALEWAIDEIPEERRAQLFVELEARPVAVPETPQLRAQGRVSQQVAVRRGVAVVKDGEPGSSRSCRPDVRGCNPGTYWIAILHPRTTPEGDVLVKLRTMIADAPGQDSPHGTVQELRLRKTDGTWRVVESRVELWVN